MREVKDTHRGGTASIDGRYLGHDSLLRSLCPSIGSLSIYEFIFKISLITSKANWGLAPSSIVDPLCSQPLDPQGLLFSEGHVKSDQQTVKTEALEKIQQLELPLAIFAQMLLKREESSQAVSR